MYKTILLTLDGTPTDRAIIEHIKQLAKLTQGRVVLLHVADGWAARTFGSDAVSPEITEDTAYLNQSPVGVSIRRHSRRGGTGLRRSAEGNRQMGRAKRMRPDGDGRTRPPAVRRHFSRQHHHRKSGTERRFQSSSSARRKNNCGSQRPALPRRLITDDAAEILRTLDEVQQIPLAILEKQNPSAARRRTDFLREFHAALFQFRLRRVNRIHAQRDVPETGELVVAAVFRRRRALAA